jgi:hypothetical protein
VAHPTTSAARLRAAIDASPYSIRSLAKALAARPGMTASEDSIRRTLSKKLSGQEAIGDAWAEILENELVLEDGYLHERDYSRILALSAQLVRRLDAGETLPAETLLELADATDEAARAARSFAARLRRASQNQQ